MRVVLNVLCGFTVVASLWLAVMFVVLHRPGFEVGVLESVLFVAQASLTLAVVNRLIDKLLCRAVVLAGAVGILCAGFAAVASTLHARHFEGFALVIGGALVLQGVVTLQHLITSRFASSSKVHQFGN